MKVSLHASRSSFLVNGPSVGNVSGISLFLSIWILLLRSVQQNWYMSMFENLFDLHLRLWGIISISDVCPYLKGIFVAKTR
jgi:hypothetical protein